MKPIVQAVQGYRLAGAAFWQARTDQERRFLGVGGTLAGLALVYALLIAPAVNGRAQLLKDLPQLRQEAAEIEALARQAAELARLTPPAAAPVSRASLAQSLTARGLTPQSLSMTGEYTKLQLNGASFAALVTWLDAVRRDSRVAVQDAKIVALPTPGLVDASVTLRQGAGEAK